MKIILFIFYIAINISLVYCEDNKYTELQSSFLVKYFKLIENVINKKTDKYDFNNELYLREYEYFENLKASHPKLLNLYYVIKNKVKKIIENNKKYNVVIGNYNGINENFDGDFYEIKIIQYHIDYNNNEISIFLRNGYWWYSGIIEFKINKNKFQFLKIPEYFYATD